MANQCNSVPPAVAVAQRKRAGRTRNFVERWPKRNLLLGTGLTIPRPGIRWGAGLMKSRTTIVATREKRVTTTYGRAKVRENDQRRRERLAQREPNLRLVEARRKAGLTQQALAQAVGVSRGAVSNWERFGTSPHSDVVRGQIEELLGDVW